MKLRIPPIVQFFLCATVTLLASIYVPGLSYDSSVLKMPARIIGAVGMMLLVAAVAAFVKARTTVNPHTPETATTLVTTGLYRISRNPMYLAMAMLLIAGAVFLGNWAAFIGPVAFIALISYLQIMPEEKILRKQFGELYVAYCQQTRRWI